MMFPSPLISPYSLRVLQSEPAPGPGYGVYPVVAQVSPAAGGTIPVPNDPDTCAGMVPTPCGLLKTAVILPGFTAVKVTTSKFWPASTSSSILGNMLKIKLIDTVWERAVAIMGPVKVTSKTATRNEKRQACHI